MFDQKLSVIGEDIEIRLQHGKVIFVIEDIDAATSIVHRKKKNKSKNKNETASKLRVNGMNGCLSDELTESAQDISAIDEDIMESSGMLSWGSPLPLFFALYFVVRMCGCFTFIYRRCKHG